MRIFNDVRSMRITTGLVYLTAVVLWIRYLISVKTKAINLLFSDQWGFLTPLFEERSWWEGFFYQHLPHRQGVAFLITSWLMSLSSWDIRMEGYHAVTVIFLASLLALEFKKKFCGCLQLYDVAIPFIFLSPLHYEHTLLTPSTTPSIFPMFLICAFALVLTSKQLAIRYWLGMGIAFCSIYTGFGFFSGVVAIAVFLWLFFQAWRENKHQELKLAGIASLILIAALISFFIGYKRHGGGRVIFPIPEPHHYFEFLLLMFAGLFQLIGPKFIWLGAVLLFVTVGLTLKSLCKVMHSSVSERQMHLAVSYILLSTLFYCFALAIARTQLGTHFAQGSRYMMLLLPVFLVWHCLLFKLVRSHDISNGGKGGRNKEVVIGFIWLVWVISRSAYQVEMHQKIFSGFQNYKSQWLAAYRENDSVDEINKRASFILLGATQNKLNYLRKHRLNFLAK